MIQSGELLSQHTTLNIGGPARHFFTATTVEEMQFGLQWAQDKQVPYLILGKGSNCLFSDAGFDGLVILNKIDYFTDLGKGRFVCGAGMSFSLLGSKTARLGWAGLEWASGIPGSVGGAVTMNAGANGWETCDLLESVIAVDAQEKKIFKRSDLHFSYRTSPFQANGLAVVEATFALELGREARHRQLEILQKRKETQPLQSKSAGCMFRNPLGKSAGALIEQAGLKGLSIGGAKVSEVHANFLINTGSATCEEMQHLIDRVREQVYNHCGIELEQEVKVIEFSR